MLFPIGDDNIENGHRPIFSYLFLAANLAIFYFQSNLPEGPQANFIYTYGAIPEEISVGVDLQTLLTSIFLHGGLLHLMGNMLYLWIFADNIEAVIGNVRFLLFYLVGGLVAGVAQVVVEPNSAIPCVGASGAIAAVMGAYMVMFPGSRIKMLFFFFFMIFIPAWLFLGFWFAQQLYSVFGGDGRDAGNVAWWAHIGGFVFGLVMGLVYRDKGKRAVRY
jgi:membrane associated rhomboid family serine protease